MRLRVHRHDLVDSTNERAFAALANGTAGHGDVHVARAQSAGRGRLGRAWESAPGEGLYLSLVLRPGPPALSAVALTMAAGLGVLEAARSLGLTGARLDWPNDVVVGGRKLAGILVESRGVTPEDPTYVVGVGLNVAQERFSAGLTAERAVTSLALEGVEVSLDAAEERVLLTLAERLDGLDRATDELAERYLDETGLRRARVRVTVGDDRHEGTLVRLDLARGLALDVDGSDPRWWPLEHVRALERR